MSGGVTHKLEKTVEALDKKQLPNALYLTEKKGLERQHEWVRKAAETCVADESKCKGAIKEAKDKIIDSMTAPLESTDVEDLKAYLKEDKPVENKDRASQETHEPTDEELFLECEDCHVADAVVKAAKVCNDYPDQHVCDKIGEKIENPDVTPETWIKTLVSVKKEVEGPAKEKITGIVDDLHGYLEKRNSPFLPAFEDNKE